MCLSATERYEGVSKRYGALRGGVYALRSATRGCLRATERYEGVSKKKTLCIFLMVSWKHGGNTLCWQMTAASGH